MFKWVKFKKLMLRIPGCRTAVPVPARMFTWEVVTAFESEPSLPDLQRKFGEEFPEESRIPSFWKLVSFNGSAGRSHRYLVAVPESGRLEPCRGRYLPAQVGLFGECDDFLRKNDCNGNLRYATVAHGVLYILVFMEGRLCHWSEERGYAETGLVQERLERFDEFLKRDSLFSTIEKSGVKKFFSVLDDDADFGAFKSACRDPFWRKLHLNLPKSQTFCRHANSRWRGIKSGVWVLLSLASFWALCTAFFAWNGESAFADEILLGAPELDAPVVDFEHLDTLGMVVRKVSWNAPAVRNNEKRDDCGRAEIRLQGIVEGKIARIVLADGQRAWLRPGDSFSTFRVKSVGRDRVNLLCGTETRVVFMEGYSAQTANR